MVYNYIITLFGINLSYLLQPIQKGSNNHYGDLGQN